MGEGTGGIVQSSPPAPGDYIRKESEQALESKSASSFLHGSLSWSLSLGSCPVLSSCFGVP